jgi:hypothetical protein
MGNRRPDRNRSRSRSRSRNRNKKTARNLFRNRERNRERNRAGLFEPRGRPTERPHLNLPRGEVPSFHFAPVAPAPPQPFGSFSFGPIGGG